jgi:hypothetical protein
MNLSLQKEQSRTGRDWLALLASSRAVALGVDFVLIPARYFHFEGGAVALVPLGMKMAARSERISNLSGGFCCDYAAQN